ncbi:hypothetical protein HPB48_000135 [Haemaphysalis longicornis]|uniref:Uncharacterized protein n=1 Tax=Haemaphysalis longicornis TaxID=44386 RepID=A0A9J6F969_HAELO|nr:hypothetical protein HPB48_000135 [Haemaphysalis longicornis]
MGDVTADNDEIMESFDVKSLFTTISVDLTVELPDGQQHTGYGPGFFPSRWMSMHRTPERIRELCFCSYFSMCLEKAPNGWKIVGDCYSTFAFPTNVPQNVGAVESSRYFIRAS